MRTKLAKDPVDEALETASRGLPENPEDATDHGVRSIRVLWGEETISPVQYQNFKIGGVELVLEPKPGESVQDAYDRAWGMLDRMMSRQFDAKLQGFLGRMTTAAQAARTKK